MTEFIGKTPPDSMHAQPNNSDILQPAVQLEQKVHMLRATAQPGSMMENVGRCLDEYTKYLEPGETLTPDSWNTILQSAGGAFAYETSYYLQPNDRWDTEETIAKRQALENNPTLLGLLENQITFLEEQGVSVARDQVEIVEATGYLDEGESAIYLEEDQDPSRDILLPDSVYIIPYGTDQRLAITIASDENFETVVTEGIPDSVKNAPGVTIKMFVAGEYIDQERTTRPI